MIPREYTQAELKKHWGYGPPTRETPCGGCKYVTSVQGYFYSCTNPIRLSAYYGFLDNEIPETGLKTCWVPRTTKPKNINPSNPLGE